MKRFLLMILMVAFLVACSSKNPIDTPKTPMELAMWADAQQVLAQEQNKAKTIWMYSTGSFALFALGLALIAFLRNKFAGAVFILGGIVGMATIWVFESEWFPWVAGGTVGLIILNVLAFAWVKAYRHLFQKEQPCNGEQGKDVPRNES
jgi:hypothetical protein